MPIPQYIKSTIAKNDSTINEIKINSELFDEDIPELVELLNDNSYITSLNLYRNNIGDCSSTKLSELKHIKKLNLSANNLSDEGIKPLIMNSNFSHIDLSRNNLTNEGANFIAENSKQIFINISSNIKIDEEILANVNKKINKVIDSSIQNENTLFNHNRLKRKANFEDDRPKTKPRIHLDQKIHAMVLVLPLSTKDDIEISNETILDDQFAKDLSSQIISRLKEINSNKLVS